MIKTDNLKNFRFVTLIRKMDKSKASKEYAVQLFNYPSKTISDFRKFLFFEAWNQ